MKFLLIASIITCISIRAFCQDKPFTHADSLRGTLTPARTCYDVSFYYLKVKIDPSRQSVSGSNEISFRTTQNFDSLQIDLFPQLTIDSILFKNKKLKYRRDANAVFVRFEETQRLGGNGRLDVYYHGKPIVAKRAPWDGGFSWGRDTNGKPWIGVSCQGTGASCWWPCKDHQSDEPDSMRMDFTTVPNLRCVSNGKLLDTKDNDDGTVTWQWKVSYPINNYNVTFNLADYAYFSENFIGINGDTLLLEFYPLQYNLPLAKEHFKQVAPMLACYEKYFGPYPFYRDGYKLVETTYWGMEHQSCIAYGNAFQNTPHGFDFIIVHESGHEWWGNLLTSSDIADMWLHEGFTTYGEALYMECRYDYQTALRYMQDMRWQIADEHPVVGPYGVNFEGSKNDHDMYYKGAWLIHSFRSQLNNDSLFFSILHGLLKEFAFVPATTDNVLQYIGGKAGAQYIPFFNQYLHYPNPPLLVVTKRSRKKGTELKMRWKTDVKDFTMNVEFISAQGKQTFFVTSEKQTIGFIPNVKPRDVKPLNERYYFKEASNK